MIFCKYAINSEIFRVSMFFPFYSHIIVAIIVIFKLKYIYVFHWKSLLPKVFKFSIYEWRKFAIYALITIYLECYRQRTVCTQYNQKFIQKLNKCSFANLLIENNEIFWCNRILLFIYQTFL